MAQWYVKHKDHDGNILDEFKPENLTFTLQLGQLGPHSVSYELSLQHAELHHTKYTNKIGPYLTDFELWRDNRIIIAGIHTPLEQDDIEADAVKISGKNWLHYLEKRHYPTVGYDDIVTGSGVTSFNVPPAPRAWIGEDIGTILTNMLEETRDIDSYSLDFTCDVPSFGIALPLYRIDFGDTEFLYSKVQTLSHAYYDMGFDFEMTNDKTFRVYQQEYDPSFTPIWGILPNGDGDPKPPGLIDVAFTNQGIEGTHAVGAGSGSAVRAIVNSHYRINSGKYRRIDMIADIGDLGPDHTDDPIGQLKAQTNSAISVGANPFKELTVTLKPDLIGTFWQKASPGFWPGRYIYLDHDLYWHHIDNLYKIVSIDFTITNEGDETAVVKTNQQIVFNPSDGYPDP